MRLACVASAMGLLACGGGSATAPAPATAALTVTNGYGPASVARQGSVEVWADVQPQNEVVTGWSGATFSSDAEEWHATVAVGDADVAVTAARQRVDVVFEMVGYTAPTGVAKTARGHIPAAARGLILFLHGTSGSSLFIEKLEARYLALKAISQGYAVMAPEAEESQAGDLDGNGRQRWFTRLAASNIDLQALDALLASLYSSGRLAVGLPVYALGMSNGGAMAVTLGAVASSAEANRFPNLRFKAVIAYCAQGRSEATAVTATPTAWYLCGNDDHPEVSNPDALASSAALAARGVPSVGLLHPATPLYDERFARVSGVSLDQSRAVASEMRTAQLVDANSFFSVTTSDIQARIGAQPTSYPAFLALTPSQQKDVGEQIAVMRAEHQMYADWASRSLKWFQQFP